MRINNIGRGRSSIIFAISRTRDFDDNTEFFEVSYAKSDESIFSNSNSLS